MLQKSIKNEINTQTELIIEAIMEKYPQTDEEEIIDILRNKNILSLDLNSKNSTILQKYGFDNSKFYSQIIRKYNEQNLILFITIIIFIFLAIIIYLNLYYKKQNKKIKEINKYIEDISNNKNYELKIKENTEEESADNSKIKSKNLEKSLEDISHQIKAPLTSIRIMLDNIEDNPDMDEKTKNDFIESISNQVELISKLVINLLNVAKFDSGTIKLKNKEFVVGDLLIDIKNNLGIIADAKQVKIEIEGDISSRIKADYRWQKEAITNIVKNAIEHSKENSKVIILVEKTNVFLQIKIQDFGEGISRKDLKHIFERFYKTNNSLKDSIGIGLNFSKTIIEKSGGVITVDSVENEGTTFTIKYLK